MKSTALQFFWLFPISLYKFSLAGDKCRHFWTSTKFIILRKKKSSAIIIEKAVQQSLVPLLVVISWKKTLIHALKVGAGVGGVGCGGRGESYYFLPFFLFTKKSSKASVLSLLWFGARAFWHCQAFWQCKVSVGHFNVIWTDNQDVRGNC